MNIKRFILSFAIVFVFIFFYEWLFHGILLKEVYAQSPTLWRSPEALSQHFHWLVLGQAVMAFMLSLIYFKCCQCIGVGPGLGFGILIGLLFFGPTLVMYAVQPLPVKLVWSWFAGDLIETAIVGALLGSIYRPPVGAPQPA